jgi:hypothetical protein
VFVGVSGEGEFAGALEDGGVAVGGADAQGEQGACGVGLAAEGELFCGAAVAQLVAGFEAQEFVDGEVPCVGFCFRILSVFGL